MRQLFRRALALSAAVTMGGALAACGSSDTTEGGGDSSGPIELTIGTFTEFGYEELLEEYEAANPNITIKHNKTGQGGPYHEQLFTKMGAGSGLEDVVAIEEGHLSDILAKSSLFHDLSEIGPDDVTPDRWLEWKSAQATDKDGKWIGYGTDIGPLAMCYRKDLFEDAGLPSDPEEVKPLFETWDSYFEAGDKFIAASDVAWYDSSAQIFNAMHNQLPVGFFDTEDNLVIESNSDIKANWDKVTAATQRGQSAKLNAFSNEWNSGFQTGAFATKTCPSWMLGVIKAQAGDANAGKWAVTDAFPGGGGNWGGSFLAVPTQSDHPEEAAKLAAWLTAPEQQIKAFQQTGNFPSQVEAQDAPELLETKDDYFGGISPGALFAAQAVKVNKPQYKGPGDGRIQETVTSPALQAVEEGTSPADGWTRVVEGAKKIAD